MIPHPSPFCPLLEASSYTHNGSSLVLLAIMDLSFEQKASQHYTPRYTDIGDKYIYFR